MASFRFNFHYEQALGFHSKPPKCTGKIHTCKPVAASVSVESHKYFFHFQFLCLWIAHKCMAETECKDSIQTDAYSHSKSVTGLLSLTTESEPKKLSLHQGKQFTASYLLCKSSYTHNCKICIFMSKSAFLWAVSGLHLPACSLHTQFRKGGSEFNPKYLQFNSPELRVLPVLF